MTKRTPRDAKRLPGRRGAEAILVERIQTGVRIEKRILKVLKAIAEVHDITLGNLLESSVLHAFEGRPAFGEASLKSISELKRIYRLDLDASASHRMTDSGADRETRKRRR